MTWHIGHLDLFPGCGEYRSRLEAALADLGITIGATGSLLVSDEDKFWHRPAKKPPPFRPRVRDEPQP